MIYGFIRQSNGQARIDSEVGSGTSVSLYLPRCSGEDDAKVVTNDVQHVPLIRNEQRSDLHRQTVLIVDHEPAVLTLMSELLQEMGYLTLKVTTGTETLDLLRSHARIDLLVADWDLPGTDGRALSAAALAAHPGLKILFMTSSTDTATFDAGPSGRVLPGRSMIVLAKPFSMDVLMNRIDELLAPDFSD